MSATDELRRLLDERGVEWWEEYGFTYWRNRFGYSCNCATGHESGMVSVLFDAKPEQAVEATLGMGTCRNISPLSNWKDNEEFTCSECGFDGTYELGVPSYCPNCGRKVVDA